MDPIEDWLGCCESISEAISFVRMIADGKLTMKEIRRDAKHLIASVDEWFEDDNDDD